jgi:hypothetical protein
VCELGRGGLCQHQGRITEIGEFIIIPACLEVVQVAVVLLSSPSSVLFKPR